MKVPLLDLQAQLKPIEDELVQAVQDVVRSTQYVLGPKVQELEQAVAQIAGAKFGVGVSSGTDALLVSLMALDVGPGDIVVTTPYSFFATAGAVVRVGATPAFVDIDPLTYNLDPAQLAQWFEQNPDKADRVKAIVPVHLYGQCADMEPILKIAGERGVAVVEDAAQAIGATYPGAEGIRRAGGMGDTACFSFYPSKNLNAIGDAGMVVTSSEALAEKLTQLRNHGASPKYYHAMIGGNFRLDAIQAAALLVKLPHLETWHEMRRKNAAYYDEALQLEQLRTPHLAYARGNHIYNQYVVEVDNRRDELRQHLAANEIGSEVYYPIPFHLQKCFARLGYKQGDFPASERAATHTLALPIYPECTDAMKAFVVEKIRDFFGD